MEKEKHEFEKPTAPLFTVWRFMGVTLLAIAYGVLMLIIFRTADFGGDPAYITFLVLVPAGIGVMSVFSIPPQHRTILNVILMAVFTTIMFMVMAVFISSGIFLCVLMIAPFILIPAVIAALIFRFVMRRFQNYQHEKQKRHYAFVGFVLLLPFLLTPVENSVPPPVWQRTVADSILINGTPETVWQHIIRMEDISPQEQRPSFYHTMGIPRPIRATLDKEGVGGIRQGQFEYGLLFYEEITVWNPNREIRFSVEVHHNDHSTPVLMQIGGRYFDILEAGYQIEPLTTGQVRLTLDGTYRLSTNFNFYGAFWSDWIMHDFQVYVLNTIKQRVEAAN